MIRITQMPGITIIRMKTNCAHRSINGTRGAGQQRAKREKGRRVQKASGIKLKSQGDKLTIQRVPKHHTSYTSMLEQGKNSKKGNEKRMKIRVCLTPRYASHYAY